MIKLRPHHLLCILAWRGQGYDERFSANFDRIIAELRTSVEVELIDGRDDVCASCPKSASEACAPAGEGAAAGIDERLVERAGIITGRIYPFGSLLDSIRKLTPADVKTICRGCSWFPRGWCKAALDDHRNLSKTVPRR